MLEAPTLASAKPRVFEPWGAKKARILTKYTTNKHIAVTAVRASWRLPHPLALTHSLCMHAALLAELPRGGEERCAVQRARVSALTDS